MRPLSTPVTCLLLAVACQSPARTSELVVGSARDQGAVAPAGGDGFEIRTADGRGVLQLGGLLQTTFGVFDGDREPSTDFALRRMRPELTGRFQDTLRFALEPKFTEDDVELEEAWVGAELLGRGVLRVGRMKAPFNLEEVRSRRHIDFTHFSILNQLAPAEDHGVFWNGESDGGRWEYGLAAYNGTGESDTTSSKDVALRLMVHPFVHREPSPWTNLQLGVAATFGEQDEEVGEDVIENELGLPVVRYEPDLRLDGTRVRFGLELAWFHGPTFLQAEGIAVAQDMERSGNDETIAFHGAYLTLAHVLTGETKTFDGVTPARPFDFGTGAGRGAWILAARASELRLDDDLEELDFAVPGSFTDSIRTLSLGLNWVPNVHMIVRTALVYSTYDEAVRLDSGSDDEELGFLVEFQLHF